MDSSLAELVRGGVVTPEMALDRCHDPEELKRLVARPDAAGGSSYAMAGMPMRSSSRA
jgi:hypothetical protein